MRHLFQPKNVLLLVASCLGGSFATAAPGYAATFANSQAFFQFNIDAPAIGTITTTEATATARQGTVLANSLADAEAFSFGLNSVTLNDVSSVVSGDGSSYFGQTRGEASILSDFAITGGDQFSFDFFGFLNLEAEVDDPSIESAKASGIIEFQLLDLSSGDILEEFSLLGQVDSSNRNDFIGVHDVTTGISLLSAESFTNFGGLQESGFTSVVGSYTQTFEKSTVLRLVEVKSTQAMVKAPEPTGSFLTLVIVAGGCLTVARRRLSAYQS